MNDANRVDLGSVKIHKKVLAEIAMTAMRDIKGVRLIKKDLTSNVCELLGIKKQPGIHVTVDKNNQVIVEVKVKIDYGLNIPDVARQTQDAIRTAVERTVDIDLKDVNVNIQGIERRGK